MSSEPIDPRDYLRLKSENQRLQQELHQLRGGTTPHTILGMRDMLLIIGASGEVTYANAAALMNFGLSREAMLGKPVAALDSEDLHGGSLAELVRDAIAVNAPRTAEAASSATSP